MSSLLLHGTHRLSCFLEIKMSWQLREPKRNFSPKILTWAVTSPGFLMPAVQPV